MTEGKEKNLLGTDSPGGFSYPRGLWGAMSRHDLNPSFVYQFTVPYSWAAPVCKSLHTSQSWILVSEISHFS